MMNLAEKWGLRPDGSNPCRHVERYPERHVERFLSKEELSRLRQVLSEAEAGSQYLSQNDFKIARAIDKINAADKNIGQMEGTIARHSIAILQGKDEGRILEGEIIRLRGRIKDEEENIDKQEKYITCLDADREHCSRILGVTE